MKSLRNIQAGDQSYFLTTTSHGDGGDDCTLDVVLTDAVNAWTGCISDKDFKDLSKKIGEELGKFKEETRQALTGVDAGNLLFEYEVTAIPDGCRELAWKRVMSEDDIKFQLGAVRLVPEDDPSVHIRSILQYSMDEMAASQLKIKNLQKEQDRLSREREQALKRLDKCVEMKEKLDKDLYSKFCIVLNEKKAKIRQLKQNGGIQAPIEDDVADGEDVDGSPSRDDGMGDVSTDEEKEVSRKHKQPKRNLDNDGMAEDSLILGEEEETKPTTSYGKRRKRKLEVKQPVIQSKPSIPRVPSTPKSASSQNTSRSGRTQSLRNNPPSNTRRGQAPELDASDLFDEM